MKENATIVEQGKLSVLDLLALKPCENGAGELKFCRFFSISCFLTWQFSCDDGGHRLPLCQNLRVAMG